MVTFLSPGDRTHEPIVAIMYPQCIICRARRRANSPRQRANKKELKIVGMSQLKKGSGKPVVHTDTATPLSPISSNAALHPGLFVGALTGKISATPSSDKMDLSVYALDFTVLAS